MKLFRAWFNDVQHVWSVCLFGRFFFCLEVCMCYIYGIANCKFDDWDNHLHYPFLGFLLHGRFFLAEPRIKRYTFLQTWQLNRMWTSVNHVSARTFSIWVDRSMLLRLGTRKGDGKAETFVARAWFLPMPQDSSTCRVICLLGLFHNLLTLYNLQNVHNNKTGPVGSSLNLLSVGGSPPLKVWQGVIWFGNFYRVLIADPG